MSATIPSYEKFDYSLRPNKRTQRKMIFDAPARYLTVFPERHFGYVGFGSMWFADFLYAHRRLGIRRLTSIELPEGYRRAVYNRPFKCVKVKEGNSSMVLPKLSWKAPSIVWLDYDYTPERESLQDIALLADRFVSGSVLMATYDARPPWKDNAPPQEREASLRAIFGDAVPFPHGGPSRTKARAGSRRSTSALTHRSDYAATLTSVLWTYLQNLLVQNGRAASGLEWLPLFSFFYKDGAPMITIGGALLSLKDMARVRQGELEKHLVYLRGKTLVPIAIPPLTPKERAELDRRLPSEKIALPFPLPVEYIESYASLYRYYPLFAEVDL